MYSARSTHPIRSNTKSGPTDKKEVKITILLGREESDKGVPPVRRANGSLLCVHIVQKWGYNFPLFLVEHKQRKSNQGPQHYPATKQNNRTSSQEESKRPTDSQQTRSRNTFPGSWITRSKVQGEIHLPQILSKGENSNPPADRQGKTTNNLLSHASIQQQTTYTQSTTTHIGPSIPAIDLALLRSFSQLQRKKTYILLLYFYLL